jgi:hypothetical protein
MITPPHLTPSELAYFLAVLAILVAAILLGVIVWSLGRRD